MKDDEITTYKIDVYDTQKFQDTFVEWFSQFKDNVIDKEFENGSKGDGVVVKSKDGLTFEFSTKWKVSIEKVNPDREEVEDGEDSEELRKEKEHNKKYGVEIKETFPFPEFDSGVPQDDEDNKGNK